MVSETEQNLAHQANLKFMENPAFKPSQEEWNACLMMLLDEYAGMLKTIVAEGGYTLQPDGCPEKITKILDAQYKWDQKNIRQHEVKLVAAQLMGFSDSDMDLLLKGCRLHLVPLNVVWSCLGELFQARVHQSQLVEAELGAFAAQQYIKFFSFDSTVDMQALDMGLEVVEPNRKRGLFRGPVVGIDHRAVLIKFCESKALVLPFGTLAAGQERPGIGDTVLMKFNEGALIVTVEESESTLRKRALEAMDTNLVTSDPKLFDGRSVFTGTRVPIAVLFENLADGLTLDEILDAYPTLRREKAIEALQQAESLLDLSSRKPPDAHAD